MENGDVYYNASSGTVSNYTDKEYSTDELIRINNIVTNRMQISEVIIRNNYFNYLDNLIKNTRIHLTKRRNKMKNLVIVESPAKCKTIEKYLGSDYKVVSSKGHIRDLATTGKFGLGIDVEHDFEPNYQIIKGKNKEVTALKKEVKEAQTVYLATDPDREGETISWHIYDEIKIPDEKYKRVVFNEITKDVVINAINTPGKIDMNLVRSGETRRFLDRIIGFRLSKLMQRKTGGKSAGRVQSVALKLIVDREREIQAFVPREYWTIEADFKDFKATLDKFHGKEVEIPNEVAADEILSKLSKSFKIESVTEKEKVRVLVKYLKQVLYNKLHQTN